jgi:hypothetical protein
MLKWIGKCVEGACAMSGALLFSQLPMFMQMYSHQLLGRVAELKLQTVIMEKAAGQTGKSLGQYIQKFLSSSDSDFRVQGKLMQGMVDRLQLLTEHLQALQNASVWERPYVFFKSLHWDVAKETLWAYVPGMTFSLEGAVYAFIGMGFGYFIFFCLSKFASSFSQRLVLRER